MSENKKRKKQYYMKCAKKGKYSKQTSLDAGMKGFLITCNRREKEAVREAYNLLNEQADKLLGPENVVVEEGSDDDVEDAGDALEKELAQLKQSNEEKRARRFQVVDSGANNVLFIKTTVDDPSTLTHSIFSQVYESRTCKSRFIMRMLPVSGTCKVHSQEVINNLAKTVLKPFFDVPHSPSFCILFKARNNAKISKRDIHVNFGDIINKMNALSCVEFKDPDVVINVDVIRNICCISIVKDFYKFKKYNLQEVASAQDDVSSKQENKTETHEINSDTQISSAENHTKGNAQEEDEIKQVETEEVKNQNASKEEVDSVQDEVASEKAKNQPT